MAKVGLGVGGLRNAPQLLFELLLGFDTRGEEASNSRALGDTATIMATITAHARDDAACHDDAKTSDG